MKRRNDEGDAYTRVIEELVKRAEKERWIDKSSQDWRIGVTEATKRTKRKAKKIVEKKIPKDAKGIAEIADVI